MHGEPFKYFAYGAAASEVEVDGFTGATGCGGSTSCTMSATACPRWSTSARSRAGSCRARVGSPGGPAVGHVRRDPVGALPTQAASTYKLPSFSEMPDDFRVTLLERAAEDGAVYGSKAVGEPPLMLAFSVREALREAAAAFGPAGHQVDLGCPATPEAVFWAVAGRAPHRCCRPSAWRWRTRWATACARKRVPSALASAHDRELPRTTGEGRDALADGGLASCAASGSPGVLVTVAAVRGHAPREAGAKMVVGERRCWGTHRRRQPGAVGGRPRPCVAGVRRGRAGDDGDEPVGPRARTARRAVLRRRGHAAPRAAAPRARDRDLRDGPRRHRAGAGPGPPRRRAAPRRLARGARRRRSGWPTVTATRWRGCTVHHARGARAGARRAARRQPRADHDARPRRGRRPVRRRPALRAPGVDRADRLGGQVEPLPQAAGRRARRGGAGADHHTDRAARTRGQATCDDRRERRRGPAAATGTRANSEPRLDDVREAAS